MIRITEQDFSPDLYSRLGIDPEASAVDITRAYKKRAVETHPDRNHDNPNATAEFVAIGRAHEILKDPELRSLYDRQLALRDRTYAPSDGSLRSDFGASHFYKDFKFTPDDVRQAEERLRTMTGRDGDVRTVFNFYAEPQREKLPGHDR